MEWKFIILGMAGLIGLFLVATVIINPLRVLFRFVMSFLIGIALLCLANFLLSQVGLHIALNPATILTAGFLQIPGVILLAVLGFFFS